MEHRRDDPPTHVGGYGFAMEYGAVREWLPRLTMKRYELDIEISSAQYLDYYRGSVRYVVARTAAGVTVQFPASLLQRHVTKEGIRGHFILTCRDDFTGALLERA